MQQKPSLLLVDETIVINRPVSELFAFVSDHENYVRWYADAEAVTSTDGLPPGMVGKVYSETLRLPTGRRREFDIRVTDVEPPSLFATEGAFGPLHPRMEVRLTAQSKADTALNLRFLSRNQSAIGRLLIGTLAPRVMRPKVRAALLKLKSILP